MSAGKADFTIEQGATFGPVTIELLDENSAAVDLTNVNSAIFQIRSNVASDDKQLDLSLGSGSGIEIVSPPTLGKLTITATAAQTAAMTTGGSYDLLIGYTTGVKTRVLEGKVHLAPAVSR